MAKKNFKIIVIKPNSFSLNNIERSNKNIQKNNDQSDLKFNYEKIANINEKKFIEDTKDFISILDIENDPSNGPSNERYLAKLLNEVKIREAEILCRILNSKTNDLVTQCQFDCTNIYETDEYLFQMCYVSFYSIGQDENTKKKIWSQLPPINRLASLMQYDDRVVFGTAILLCHHLPLEDNEMKNSDVTHEDILMILENKQKHDGIILRSNGDIDKMEYGNNESFLKYKEINIKLYNFNLSFYMEDNNDKINDNAQKLLYEEIKGDVYVISKYELEDLQGYYHYEDLSIKNIQKMIAIAPENQKDITLKEDEVKRVRDSLNRTIIKSRFRILDKRYRIHKCV